QDARDGKFAMPSELRLKKKNVEQLLLAATVENLLGHEIALRVHSEDETLLEFPSQFTREHPDMPDPEAKALIYYFKGAVLNVYTTLVVRLSHSLLFGLKEMWKNAVIYSANVHGTYGIYLEEKGEGEARLVLFFGEDAPEATRFHFEEFVEEHIKRNAIPESMKRERVF